MASKNLIQVYFLQLLKPIKFLKSVTCYILFSPAYINKFLITISSLPIVAGIFVRGSSVILVSHYCLEKIDRALYLLNHKNINNTIIFIGMI